ncbi:MAG: hypothetical protein V7731_20900 [Amphritea sp.]
METVFQLKALSNEPEFIELLKMQELRHRRDAINRLVKMKNRDNEHDEFYEQALKLRKKARNYDTLYAMGSTMIHSGLLSIQEHFVIDTDNLVKELINEPSLEDYDDTIYAACDVLLNGVLAIDKIYSRGENSQVNDYIQRLNTALAPIVDAPTSPINHTKN